MHSPILYLIIILLLVYFTGKLAVNRILSKNIDVLKSIIKEATLEALNEHNENNN